MSDEFNIAYVSSIAWTQLAEPVEAKASRGGSFWTGVCSGLVFYGLNHAMHLLTVGAVSATTSSDGTIIPCVKADLYVEGKMVSWLLLIDNEGFSIVSEGHQNVGTVRFDVPESVSIIEVRVQGGWNVSRFIGNNAVMNSNNFGRVGFDETHQVYF